MAETLIQYHYKVLEAFHEYLDTKDVDNLIAALQKVEQYHRNETDLPADADMWFRFGSDDTLVNTISDIQNDLRKPSGHPNRKMMESNLTDACKNADIEIYFS